MYVDLSRARPSPSAVRQGCRAPSSRARRTRGSGEAVRRQGGGSDGRCVGGAAGRLARRSARRSVRRSDGLSRRRGGATPVLSGCIMLAFIAIPNDAHATEAKIVSRRRRSSSYLDSRQGDARSTGAVPCQGHVGSILRGQKMRDTGFKVEARATCPTLCYIRGHNFEVVGGLVRRLPSRRMSTMFCMAVASS